MTGSGVTSTVRSQCFVQWYKSLDHRAPPECVAKMARMLLAHLALQALMANGACPARVEKMARVALLVLQANLESQAHVVLQEMTDTMVSLARMVHLVLQVKLESLAAMEHRGRVASRALLVNLARTACLAPLDLLELQAKTLPTLKSSR